MATTEMWRGEWKKIDVRGRGTMSFAELPRLCEGLGLALSEDELEETATKIQKWQASRLLVQGFARWFTGDGGLGQVAGEREARACRERTRAAKLEQAKAQTEAQAAQAALDAALEAKACAEKECEDLSAEMGRDAERREAAEITRRESARENDLAQAAVVEALRAEVARLTEARLADTADLHAAKSTVAQLREEVRTETEMRREADLARDELRAQQSKTMDDADLLQRQVATMSTALESLEAEKQAALQATLAALEERDATADELASVKEELQSQLEQFMLERAKLKRERDAIRAAVDTRWHSMGKALVWRRLARLLERAASARCLSPMRIQAVCRGFLARGKACAITVGATLDSDGNVLSPVDGPPTLNSPDSALDDASACEDHDDLPADDLPADGVPDGVPDVATQVVTTEGSEGEASDTEVSEGTEPMTAIEALAATEIETVAAMEIETVAEPEPATEIETELSTTETRGPCEDVQDQDEDEDEDETVGARIVVVPAVVEENRAEETVEEDAAETAETVEEDAATAEEDAETVETVEDEANVVEMIEAGTEDEDSFADESYAEETPAGERVEDEARAIEPEPDMDYFEEAEPPDDDEYDEVDVNDIEELLDSIASPQEERHAFAYGEGVVEPVAADDDDPDDLYDFDDFTAEPVIPTPYSDYGAEYDDFPCEPPKSKLPSDDADLPVLDISADKVVFDRHRRPTRSALKKKYNPAAALLRPALEPPARGVSFDKAGPHVTILDYEEPPRALF